MLSLSFSLFPSLQQNGIYDTGNFPSDEIMDEPEYDDDDEAEVPPVDPLEPNVERDSHLRRDRFMGFSYRSFMALQEEFGSI